MKAQLSPQHFLHYKSMGNILGSQGQVTQILKANSLIWLVIELMQYFISVLVTCKFHDKYEGSVMSTTFFPELKWA